MQCHPTSDPHTVRAKRTSLPQPDNSLAIRFNPAGPGAYRLAPASAGVAGPRLGETSGAFTPPFDPPTWPAIRRTLEPGTELSAADRDTLAPLGGLPETAGRALADGLFTSGLVRSAFAQALAAIAAAERRSLLVELRFAGASDAAAALPWELLHHDGRFLVTDTFRRYRRPISENWPQHLQSSAVWV